jgi:hypothetical protein
MKFIKISPKICGATAIALATLLEAAPSKAVLYIDFIPLSPTQTRIQASGNLNRSLLGTSTSGSKLLAPTGSLSSGILSVGIDILNFTYALSPPPTPGAPPLPFVIQTGRLYSLTGTSNPFNGTGGFGNWSGTTPANNPPLILRFTTPQDLWLPDTYISGAAINGFFDVNLSLAQIGLAGPSIVYASGSEQIILRDATPTTPTPGPVPLLGAAAAFGYSRKLRNRIQKSTPSRTA